MSTTISVGPVIISPPSGDHHANVSGGTLMTRSGLSPSVVVSIYHLKQQEDVSRDFIYSLTGTAKLPVNAYAPHSGYPH